MDIPPDLLARFFADLNPQFDERRRRLLSGATARLLGRGGVSAVSRASGMSRRTVAAGVAEVDTPRTDAGTVDRDRVRNHGAGRKSVADREPQLIGALNMLLAGKPGTTDGPLDWNLMSSYEIADHLRADGFTISSSSAGS